MFDLRLKTRFLVTTQPICELTTIYDQNRLKPPFTAIGMHPKYGACTPFLAFSAIYGGHRRDA
jgi:hypothetical protein